ncbi:MAG TPA: PHP domain-containing protein, partial [Anaerolineales bacterium]|nr:PHP domain-containing protein [Anaerolineales bacterium]
MAKKRPHNNHKWYTIDLHLHTPASSDYQQPEVSYLDLLKRAEARGLDLIAFTDHNTVAGYRKMQEEIQQLELLEKLNRLIPEERTRLNEYRRLLNKILVFPGFEFTATFGFHILGIFSPLKPVREIEHLLLTLKIPPAQLDEGSSTVGATADVLTAYRLINEAGGLVIAAHANSTNGVAMLGLNFGGQTKIAYTQDPNLHALEVTDLGQNGRHATSNFFSGTKPEYPRRMHCLQGSDAHRLTTDPQRKKNLGVGDRATEVQLPKLT